MALAIAAATIGIKVLGDASGVTNYLIVVGAGVLGGAGGSLFTFISNYRSMPLRHAEGAAQSALDQLASVTRERDNALKRIQEVTQDKPRVRLSVEYEGGTSYFVLHNDGADVQFCEVQVEFNRDDAERCFGGYRNFTGFTDPIPMGLFRRIKVADRQVDDTKDVLRLFLTPKGSPERKAMRTELDLFERVPLKVTVASMPSMAEGAFTRAFELSFEGLTELDDNY